MGDEKVIQCSIRDILERKRSQDALLKSQALRLEQAVRDPLAGLFNRRFMAETLERELLRAMRKNVPRSDTFTRRSCVSEARRGKDSCPESSRCGALSRQARRAQLCLYG